MAKLWSPLVASWKSPPFAVSSVGFESGSSVRSGLFHAVGVAVGDHGVAVVQESVEHADGGGVFGQEAAPGFERPVGSDAEGEAFVCGS